MKYRAHVTGDSPGNEYQIYDSPTWEKGERRTSFIENVWRILGKLVVTGKYPKYITWDGNQQVVNNSGKQKVVNSTKFLWESYIRTDTDLNYHRG